MGGLNSIDGLGKVPVDYLANIAPAEAQAPAGAPQEAQGEAVAAAGEERAKQSSLLMQLDVLMLSAAGKATKSASTAAVKSAAARLMDLGILDEENKARLEALAIDAKTKLSALDKFTGRQLAGAICVGGNGATSWKKGFWGLSESAKAVKGAVEAQQALGDALQLIVAAAGRNDGVGAPLYNDLVELKMQCDRRESEIHSLLIEMHGFAQRENPDGEMKELLAATFAELMPRQALAMHGTADALGVVDKTLAGKLKPLAATLDAFADNPDAKLTEEKLLAIERDMATMKNAIADARENGIEDGNGGRIVPDKTLLGAIEKTLDEVAANLANLKQSAVNRMQTRFIADAKRQLAFAENESQLAVFTDPSNPETARFAKCCTEVIRAMELYRDAGDDRIKRAAARNLMNAAMTEAASLDPAKISGEIHETRTFTRAFFALHNFATVLLQFVDLSKNARHAARADMLDGANVRRIFTGHIRFSTAVEVRAHGFADGDYDPATDELNLSPVRTLGSGAAGSAVEVKNHNGDSFVFKAELEGGLGLRSLAAGMASYSDAQKMANLNIACQKAAAHFGCSDLLVKTSVGMYKGKFGVFMEKAPGKPVSAYQSQNFFTTDEMLAPGYVRTLRPGGRSEVVGQVMSKLNRLMWLDLITGQCDRHWDNYFLRIDPATRKVEVKGIDNDACYSEINTGLLKFSLPSSRLARLRSNAFDVARRLYGADKAAAEAARMLADRAITVNTDGSAVVDCSKIQNADLCIVMRETIGAQSLVLPDKMDKEICDRLLEMKNDPSKRAAYLADIKPRLSKKSYDAAVKRLDEAIETAGKYKERGLVYDEERWQLPTTRTRAEKIKNEMHVRLSSGEDKIISVGRNSLVDKYCTGVCPDLYTRDLLNRVL